MAPTRRPLSIKCTLLTQQTALNLVVGRPRSQDRRATIQGQSSIQPLRTSGQAYFCLAVSYTPRLRVGVTTAATRAGSHPFPPVHESSSCGPLRPSLPQQITLEASGSLAVAWFLTGQDASLWPWAMAIRPLSVRGVTLNRRWENP